MCGKDAVYYNDVNIDRINHNGAGLTTTGMNATQTATLKKNYAKDLNIGPKQSWYQKNAKDGNSKNTTAKNIEINVGQDSLDIDFLGAAFYTTATMSKWPLKE